MPGIRAWFKQLMPQSWYPPATPSYVLFPGSLSYGTTVDVQRSLTSSVLMAVIILADARRPRSAAGGLRAQTRGRQADAVLGHPLVTFVERPNRLLCR